MSAAQLGGLAFVAVQDADVVERFVSRGAEETRHDWR